MGVLFLNWLRVKKKWEMKWIFLLVDLHGSRRLLVASLEEHVRDVPRSRQKSAKSSRQNLSFIPRQKL
jgi:hypothetical protein